MARKTPEEILESVLGPPVVIGGHEILGPNESRLLDALRARRWLVDFHVSWGPMARRMPREMRAGAALEILNEKRRPNRLSFPPRSRTPVNVREFVAGF